MQNAKAKKQQGIQLLATCRKEWYLKDTQKYGAKVAACYTGAAEECKQYDHIVGKQVFPLLFSPALDDDVVRKNKAKFAAGFEQLLLKQQDLMFAIVDEVQKADDRHRLYQGNWSPINKRTDLMPRNDFVARSKLRFKDAYYDKMRMADLIFLPVLKAIRRRLKILNENIKLPAWKSNGIWPKRPATARELATDLPALVTAIRVANPSIKQIQVVPFPAKVQRLIGMLNKLLTESEGKADEATDDRYAQLLGFNG